jgi:putative hydroxymethylpyrimidine transport system ATP-binding protein
MMKHDTPIVNIRDAYLSYDGVVLFDNLNLSLFPNRFTCLLGPSGVGKTTILKLIAGLINANKNSKEIFHGEITCDTHQIAYLAQQDCLLPWLTAFDNALLGMKLRKEKSAITRQHAKELFAKLGLTAALKKYPQQLSGGMRQRVALIRTLLEDKPIVLMDEPFSSLDAITRFELQTLASQLLKNKTVLFITHDPLEALRLADDIYILSGQPASLHLAAQPKTITPRNPADPVFIQYQAALFHELTEAKERSS